MPKNYELTDSGLLTAKAIIASMFLGIEIYDGAFLKTISSKHSFLIVDCLGREDLLHEITIPYPLIKEAYQPVEGEGYVCLSRQVNLGWPLAVYNRYSKNARKSPCYHMRVLFMLKEPTRAELRDLVKHVEGT